MLHYSSMLYTFFILKCSLAHFTMCKLQQLCIRPQNNHQQCTVSVDHHRNHGKQSVTQITHTRWLYKMIFSGIWVSMYHWRNDKDTGTRRVWDRNIHQCHFVRHIPNRPKWVRTRPSVLGYVTVGEFLIGFEHLYQSCAWCRYHLGRPHGSKEPWPNLRHCSN